jgi:hypothetical protein
VSDRTEAPPVGSEAAEAVDPARGGESSGQSGAQTAAAAVAVTYEWFHRNSGWAPPDEGSLAEWLADGVCRCPDECIVAPDQWCEHGLASWALVLAAQAAEDLAMAERLRR